VTTNHNKDGQRAHRELLPSLNDPEGPTVSLIDCETKDVSF
jgi:hypothetical protein